MKIASMSSVGFNVINNNYSRIKECTVKQLAGNGKLLGLANKIKKISNTTIAFIKKHPRNIVTGIGFASMLVGVITVNPGLICVGVSSLVAATLYTPPSLTSLPSHNEVAQYESPEAG
ncbi:hypothetical protein [Symbiopectobacterium sp. RP]|uniref:hypothetical protein n=1 Tax=Symbiopectobacterium sp. RP TaxID=3248553 RepID=UPI003D286D6B